jgi:hypothetical protein
MKIATRSLLGLACLVTLLASLPLAGSTAPAAPAPAVAVTAAVPAPPAPPAAPALPIAAPLTAPPASAAPVIPPAPATSPAIATDAAPPTRADAHRLRPARSFAVAAPGSSSKVPLPPIFARDACSYIECISGCDDCPSGMGNYCIDLDNCICGCR